LAYKYTKKFGLYTWIWSILNLLIDIYLSELQFSILNMFTVVYKILFFTHIGFF